jgi:hypothetical protein
MRQYWNSALNANIISIVQYFTQISIYFWANWLVYLGNHIWSDNAGWNGNNFRGISFLCGCLGRYFSLVNIFKNTNRILKKLRIYKILRRISHKILIFVRNYYSCLSNLARSNTKSQNWLNITEYASFWPNRLKKICWKWRWCFSYQCLHRMRVIPDSSVGIMVGCRDKSYTHL